MNQWGGGNWRRGKGNPSACGIASLNNKKEAIYYLTNVYKLKNYELYFFPISSSVNYLVEPYPDVLFLLLPEIKPMTNIQ